MAFIHCNVIPTHTEQHPDQLLQFLEKLHPESYNKIIVKE